MARSFTDAVNRLDQNRILTLLCEDFALPDFEGLLGIIGGQRLPKHFLNNLEFTQVFEDDVTALVNVTGELIIDTQVIDIRNKFNYDLLLSFENNMWCINAESLNNMSEAFWDFGK